MGATDAHAGVFTRSEIASLTYEQVKGTGLANTCPNVESGPEKSISVAGKKSIDEFCLEPTSFQVLEDKLTKNGVVTEAVNTKVTTRQTYVLTGINGDLKTVDGKLAFVEKDGIDYPPTTVQLPGGQRASGAAGWRRRVALQREQQEVRRAGRIYRAQGQLVRHRPVDNFRHSPFPIVTRMCLWY